MNINTKNYTQAATQMDYLELRVRQNKDKSFTVTGYIRLLDAADQEIIILEQPVEGSVKTQVLTAVANFRPWLLQQNGITEP